MTSAYDALGLLQEMAAEEYKYAKSDLIEQARLVREIAAVMLRRAEAGQRVNPQGELMANGPRFDVACRRYSDALEHLANMNRVQNEIAEGLKDS